MNAIRLIRAIDVHAHYSRHTAGKNEPLYKQWHYKDTQTVLEQARLANTDLTIVSCLDGLWPRGQADAVASNTEAQALVPSISGLGLWAIVNPLQEATYEQAAEMTQHPMCFGIKIHPEEHVYKIQEHGRKIFEFAAARKLVVITHSGERNSLPADFVTFANDYPDVTLILAHMGCGFDGDPSHQVRAIQQSRFGNVYVDTSSAASIHTGIIEWAVGQVGADRILYGTDSPLYFAPSQRARIDCADIPDEAKRMILCENAKRILGLDEQFQRIQEKK